MNKKPKNRVLCPDCGYQKMLFETIEKANNFIKFNKDDLDNVDKLRPYYCPACCGYHITHREYDEKYEARIDQLIKLYEEEKNNATSLDYKLIDELYEILVKLNLKNKKEINYILNQPSYKNKYSKFVQQEAKYKYFLNKK